MKGRRRARQMALQALYELDLSRHPVDVVLAGRRDDVFHSGARNALPADDWPIAADIIARRGADGIAALDPRAVAERFQISEARAGAIAVTLADVQAQADYGAEITRGVLRNRDRLDAAITRIAPEWPVDQMAPVDRNVLRVALWEIGVGRVPTRVAINEAVELARRFSGEGARRMVNGALGTFTSAGMALDLDPPEAASP